MTATIDLNQEKLEAFLDRTFTDLAACYGGVMVSLGDKLGLYRALAGAGPSSSAEPAERAGCAERYVREWLGSQVAAEYIVYDPRTETYESRPSTRPSWRIRRAWRADAAFNIRASMWSEEDQAADAFRTGEGVPGAPTRSACSAASRPSTATPTGPPSCRSGCPPSTASWSVWGRARRSRTSGAATGTRSCSWRRRSRTRRSSGSIRTRPRSRRRVRTPRRPCCPDR